MEIGAIILARKLSESEIWINKPAWWLKVWIFILMRVNHKDGKVFDRGSNFFSYKMIYDDCFIEDEGIKKTAIDGLIRWLKLTTQITTRKTTRGFIITVCNYATYQDFDTYKNDTRNDTRNETETKPKRNRNDTINNNENNDNNENKIITGEIELKKIPSWLESRAFEVFGNVPLGNLRDWTENYEESWIKEALNKTEAANVKSVNYTTKILQDWALNGKEDKQKPEPAKQGSDKYADRD